VSPGTWNRSPAVTNKLLALRSLLVRGRDSGSGELSPSHSSAAIYPRRPRARINLRYPVALEGYLLGETVIVRIPRIPRRAWKLRSHAYRARRYATSQYHFWEMRKLRDRLGDISRLEGGCREIQSSQRQVSEYRAFVYRRYSDRETIDRSISIRSLIEIIPRSG